MRLFSGMSQQNRNLAMLEFIVMAAFIAAIIFLYRNYLS
jgi:hypothetical protein